jgi:hypothetical protein
MDFWGMLRLLLGTRVVDAEGAYVELSNRETLTYVAPEGRSLEIEYLYGAWGERIVFERDFVRWSSPAEAGPLNDDDRRRALALIEEYCARDRNRLVVRAVSSPGGR